MIGMVFVGDIMFCPYLARYEDIMIKNGVEYKILFWNRSLKDYDQPKYICYNAASELSKNKLLKIADFIRYRKWLTKVLEEYRFERLIVLDTLSGILIGKYLKKNYRKKYILDIRDYSYEKFKLFKKLEKAIIDNSAFVSISSEGFKSFLPKSEKYINTHNIGKYEDTTRRNVRIKKTGKLNFVWMGSVRYYKTQSTIIKRLSNDNRFALYYHGIGPQYEKLKEYAESINARNVYFTGEYNNLQKEELLIDADIINNCYNHNDITKFAVSNKFYDGILFHIPQVVETNCYKSQILNKYPFGVALSPDDEDFAEKLLHYYYSINIEKFDKFCDEYMRRVVMEDSLWQKKIDEFMMGIIS